MSRYKTVKDNQLRFMKAFIWEVQTKEKMSQKEYERLQEMFNAMVNHANWLYQNEGDSQEEIDRRFNELGIRY